MIHSFNADLALNVIQFLNVTDSGRLALCSKRYYYLVHQYRLLRGPELVTVAGWDASTGKQKTAKQISTLGFDRLQKAPNLVLAFGTQTGGNSLQVELPKVLPKDAIVLGAVASNIQVNHNQVVEHESNASVMYASFPGAVFHPFSIEYGDDVENDIENLKKHAVDRQDEVGGWKAVIVYASGHGAALAETLVSTMQEALPEAAIVGGMCGEGFVSRVQRTKKELSKMPVGALRRLACDLGAMETNEILEKSELVEHVYSLSETAGRFYHAEDAVYGILFGGDAPMRSMVSRGVKSIIEELSPSTTRLSVEEVALVRPDDEDYIFRGDQLKPVHMIRSVRNDETGQVLPAIDIMAKTSGYAEFIGLRRPNTDGFELHMLSPYCQVTGAYLVMTDGSLRQEESLAKAELDFFVLDCQACLEDMDRKVARLKEHTRGEEILGAVMVSCSGRGPSRGMLIPEVMADATRFAKGFPNVPCLGFYAGGEIGPLALAKMDNEVFQTGRVAIQGFTAVFALFIVPVVELNFQLDDCQENVDEFIRNQIST